MRAQVQEQLGLGQIRVSHQPDKSNQTTDAHGYRLLEHCHLAYSPVAVRLPIDESVRVVRRRLVVVEPCTEMN